MSFLFLLLISIIINNKIEWITAKTETISGQVVQPIKQEMERFKVIQEQIKHHQKVEQAELEKKQERMEDQMDKDGQESQIPAESFLIPEPALIPMFFQLPKTPIPALSAPVPYSNHRVPMPPLISSPIITFGTKSIPAHLSSNPYPPTQQIQAAIWSQMNMNNPFYDKRVKLINEQPTSTEYRINKQESKQDYWNGKKDFIGKNDKQKDFGKIIF